MAISLERLEFRLFLLRSFKLAPAWYQFLLGSCCFFFNSCWCCCSYWAFGHLFRVFQDLSNPFPIAVPFAPSIRAGFRLLVIPKVRYKKTMQTWAVVQISLKHLIETQLQIQPKFQVGYTHPIRIQHLPHFVCVLLKMFKI